MQLRDTVMSKLNKFIILLISDFSKIINSDVNGLKILNRAVLWITDKVNKVK